MLLFLLVVLPFFQLASEISVLSLIPLISSLSQSDDSFQLFFAVFPHFISIELLTHQNFLIILSSLASASSDWSDTLILFIFEITCFLYMHFAAK